MPSQTKLTQWLNFTLAILPSPCLPHLQSRATRRSGSASSRSSSCWRRRRPSRPRQQNWPAARMARCGSGYAGVVCWPAASGAVLTSSRLQGKPWFGKAVSCAQRAGMPGTRATSPDLAVLPTAGVPRPPRPCCLAGAAGKGGVGCSAAACQGRQGAGRPAPAEEEPEKGGCGVGAAAVGWVQCCISGWQCLPAMLKRA